MIITLSPAKMMKFDSLDRKGIETKATFTKEALELVGELKQFSVEEILKLMSVNPKQAMEVYQQINAFGLDRTPQKQAMFAYNGIAFQGLDAKSFSEKDVEYAQKHLIIFSGLYGALRPMDMIKPYRLEMQIPLENSAGSSLYDFWRVKLTRFISDRLNEDDKIWINLASNEYTKVIDKKILPQDIRIIEPNFKQQTAKGYKQIVVYTKKARGMMSRFIIQNRITDIEHLKGFDDEGYTFSPELSKGAEWVYVR